MMLHAGGFDVISEPFLNLYKQSLISQEKHIQVGQRVRKYCEKLIQRRLSRHVFVKEMAYHANDFITDEFIDQTRHVFLIRDPKYSIPSLYKMRAEYTEDQTGFHGQLALLNRIKKNTGETPFIIDAETLLRQQSSVISTYFDYLGLEMPNEVLTWPRGSSSAWQGRESWHVDAIESEGFEQKSKEIDLDKQCTKVKNSISLASSIYFEMHRQSLVQSKLMK
ncbi:hypothetical protein NBRC116583_12250 [Arenicella sp. 4NH20-0111]